MSAEAGHQRETDFVVAYIVESRSSSSGKYQYPVDYYDEFLLYGDTPCVNKRRTIRAKPFQPFSHLWKETGGPCDFNAGSSPPSPCI